MNILRRLFNGGVTKPRQVATDQQEGNAPRFSPRSALPSRQAGSTSSRAGSGVLAPLVIASFSTKLSPSSVDGAAVFPEVRIKQEDEEEGTFVMNPPRNDESDLAAALGQMDGADNEMATGHQWSEAVFKEEPGEDDGSFLGNLAEDKEVNGADEENAGDQHLDDGAAQENGFGITSDSDEPMPSIEYDEDGVDGGHDEQDEDEEEEDDHDMNEETDSQDEDEQNDSHVEDEEDDDQDEDGENDSQDEDEEDDDKDMGEEEEPYQPREKTPIYLHGMLHRRGPAPDDEAGDGVNNEGFAIEDEAFEEELKGEKEPLLLIDDNDLRYWLQHKRATAGIETWPTEAIRLCKLLFLRGSYPVFQSSWVRDFSQEPVPSGLFMPRGSDHLCLFQPGIMQHRETQALRKLFVIHIRVGPLVQRGDSEWINRIAAIIKRELELYVRWAEDDIGFRKKRDYISPIFIVAYKTPQAVSAGRSIVEHCQTLVDKYKAWYAQRDVQEYPRCIYIFVIVQHIVLVMVADTEKADGEEPYPLAELDLSQRSHWMDYSLAISITITLAKEALAAHRASCPEIEWETDDPDL